MHKNYLFLSLLTVSIVCGESLRPGSGMTNVEEAKALSDDSTTLKFIQEASITYSNKRSEYEQGSLTWDELNASYSQIFSDLHKNICAQIATSSNQIHLIANDYDEEHVVDYNLHIDMLLGLARNNLGISATSAFLPPLPNADETYPNLIQGGDMPNQDVWSLSSGVGTLENGQIVTSSPNGATFSKTIAVTPGHWYIISGYIAGADEGTDKYGDQKPYSGSISVVGANTSFVQTSNELDHGGLQRRYFWVEAENASMTISLSSAKSLTSTKGALFQNISVRDLNIDCSTQDGEKQAMILANSICPPANVTGSPAAGWYPQVERALASGDNLIDGDISIMKNIDQSALGNAGHPYWYFAKKVPVGKSIKIVNGLNGSHGLIIDSGLAPTTNGYVPIPSEEYTLSCDVYVPADSDGSMRISFSGTNLNDGSSIEKLYQDYSSLATGIHTLSLSIPASTFSNADAYYRPSITFANTGSSSLSIYNMKLIPNIENVYTSINNINPYNPNRSWYNAKSGSFSYDFQSGNISTDWGIALTGNAMFAANNNNVSLVDQGILLKNNNNDAGIYTSGGIQSTQFIDPMRDFTISVTFQSLGNDPGFGPTFAVWTYGESQRGLDHHLTHRNAPSADVITEFDCEMGSDPNTGQPSPTANQMYMRPGSYIGYAAGGHNEILPADANWTLMPNFWNKNSSGSYDTYTLTMSGTWQNGHLVLSRSIANNTTNTATTLLTQDLGLGPFSPMYIKIALENPSWSSKSHTVGKASILLKSITFTQGADIAENVSHKIPFSLMDYAWFTPGGGGGVSYAPFPPRS